MKMGLARLLLAIAAAWCPVGAAHTLSASHIDISERDGGVVQVELDVPLRDLALVLPLDANRDDRITWGELSAARPRFEELAQQGLTLTTATGPCALRPVQLATRKIESIAHATLQLEGRCATASGLTVRYRLMDEVVPGHAAMVTFRHPSATRVGVGRGAVAVRFEPVGAGVGPTFVTFLKEGMHHILIGYDHLAFLLSLLLPAALIRQAQAWIPVARRADALRYTVGIVTAFTLAHSITLSLAVLGVMTPAPKIIETAIAASVLLAALNNVWPLVTRRLWIAGFVFGLIHGFGFAGALGEYGLGKGTEALALLGFNLGVELGQLAVVALALPVIMALSRHRAYTRFVMPAVSLAIAALSVVWIWQRLAD